MMDRNSKSQNGKNDIAKRNFGSTKNITESSNKFKKAENVAGSKKSSSDQKYESQPKKFTSDQKAASLENHDRYIPNPISNIERFHEKIFNSGDNVALEDEKNDNCDATSSNSHFDMIQSALNVNEPERILEYSKQLPVCSNEAGTSNSVKFQVKIDNIIDNIYKPKRFIPKTSERTLDAPGLQDDFYLNLLDWGGSNVISVGLSDVCYLWFATSGKVEQIGGSITSSNLQSTLPADNISSIKWSGIDANSCIAIGHESGAIKIWDVQNKKCIRTISDNKCRVGALSWNRYILSSGNQSGDVCNFDVRLQKPLISRMTGNHTLECCSLAWSYDGRHLASGGNDNLVNVWTYTQISSAQPPVHSLVAHRAAVKGLAWHHTEHNLLASGGGTADGNIYFWNTYNGTRLASISTNSQISGLLWTPHYSEIISSHGYPSNRLSIWSYPSLNPVANLTGHSQRILTMVLSPDGTSVATLGADETLRLWKCFDIPKKSTNSLTNLSNTKRQYIPIR